MFVGIGVALGVSVLSMEARAAEEARINQVGASDQDIVGEYRATIDRLQDLREYNATKRDLTKDQDDRMAALRGEIASIKSWQAELPDLMEEMIQTLEEFIASDIPFRKSDRELRVEEIRNGLFGLPESATEEAKTVARFHKVLEAIQIENDYGRSIETYKGTIETGDEPLRVDFLMVGRVALFYQAKEGPETGMWDHVAGAWITDLPTGAEDQVREAIAVAKEEIPPNLLLLPLPTPRDP